MRTVVEPAPAGAAIAASRRIGRPVWALLGLTALAAAVRFGTLNGQSFWLDESYALGDIRFSTLGGMFGWIRAHEMTPPLFFLVARAWTRVFGTDEVGFRSLSALLGTATVPVVYLAGAALRSRRLGLIAAAFAAVSPVLIWYSQEGRNYALAVFLSAVAFLALVHVLRGAGTWWLAGWSIACALLLGTHYFAVFYVAGLALVVLLRARRAPVMSAVVTLAVLELLLVPYALDASGQVGFNAIRAIPVPYRLAQIPSQFAWGPVEGSFGPWAIAAAALVITAAALIAALRFGDPLTRWSAALPATVLAVSLGGPVALTLVGVDYLTPRYLLPSWIPLAFAWAAPLAAGRLRLVAAMAACIAWAGASAYLLTSSDLQRPGWRAVAAALGPAAVNRAVVAPHAGLPLRLYLTRRELDHGLAPSTPRSANVSEVALVGVAAEHRQGCWWGGMCQLPSRLRPRLVPPAPGFRLSRTLRVGRFTITVFRSPAERRVPLDGARLYTGTDAMGLISFVQQPGPPALR
jgi:4-amino-4-deoxy-L-arabinose transferase-like glycosyltransferase